MSPHSTGNYQSFPQEHTTIDVGHVPDRSLFSAKEIRAQFVSKVFTILFGQLVVAVGLIAWFSFHEPTTEYMKLNGPYYFLGAFGITFVTLIILRCVESARRTFPVNFILLAVITVAFGLMAAIGATQYEKESVFGAACATAVATLVIALLAKYSSLDITTCGCALLVLGIVHLSAALLLAILLPSQTTSVIIASSGAFLVSLYMLFDLQLIMGGRQLEISPEEYIMAALILYIDIINLFQYLLILFGNRR